MIYVTQLSIKSQQLIHLLVFRVGHALVLLRLGLVGLLLGLLLHQVVVLDPKGDGVHDHGNDEHHHH